MSIDLSNLDSVLKRNLKKDRLEWEQRKIDLAVRVKKEFNYESKYLFNRPYHWIIDGEDTRWFLWLCELGEFLQSRGVAIVFSSMNSIHMYNVITHKLDNLHDGQKTILKS